MRSASLALCSLLVLSACSDPPAEHHASATPVRIAEAVEGPAAPTIRTNGLLSNKDEMRLSFKVGGVIRSIAVQEGAQVKRGQRLADIEPTEVNAQVEQAKQAHSKAQRDAERGERLYADQVISLEQLQDLRTQSAVTLAGLKSAEFNSGYAAIVAPGDGTVLRRLAEPREFVGAGTPVLVIGAQDRGYVVRTGLADREIVQIHAGDQAQVLFDALPGTQLEGKVTEIASAADQGSGMFNVEVTVDPAGASLRSGLVAKLVLTPSSAAATKLVHVPIGAIVEGDGRRASVFILEGDKAVRREVDVAFFEGDAVALNNGVRTGERVVTDGALYLEDGEVVAVEQPAANATAANGP